MDDALMHHLSVQEQADRKAFRAFADEVVAEQAERCDREGSVAPDVVRHLAGAGYLGSMLSVRPCGEPLGAVSYGLLAEELGRACSSVRNLVAVTDMVAAAIARWGTVAQRERWLAPIATGQLGVAFALTEPEVGSDAAGVSTTATPDGGEYVIEGSKHWISFGQTAELFLVFARVAEGTAAFLVPRSTAGLSVAPMHVTGLRGSALAAVDLERCRVPADTMIGRPGMGIDLVASTSLDLGRYSTAWGSVGLAQACLDEAASYARQRQQYGKPIGEHQLVQQMLCDILTRTVAARLMCYHAGVCRAARDPDAVNRTLMAKYLASLAATAAADHAVQIHGARGIGSEGAVQRYFRDAKVMEIIEGTTQMHQLLLGRYAQAAA